MLAPDKKECTGTPLTISLHKGPYAGQRVSIVLEGEAGVALARLVMKHQKVEPETADRMLQALRRMWSLPE